MSCCRNKRTELVQRPVNNIIVSNPEYKPKKIWDNVNFKYVGETGLTVTGSITGKLYRFARPGDIQLVDYRDAGSMRAISVLKRL